MHQNFVTLDRGAIGQIQGPFSSGTSFVFPSSDVGKSLKIGIFIGEKDLMTYNWKFPINLNGENIIIYKAGMYEPNVALPMTSISFPQGAPASVFIDYVVLEI